ncbi:sensor histidine kinase [Fusibacter ferrireducens]|uniref:histidine kinase n=1 Tax=Fusibacter ferrireducens TaxID=2785058 RepID=A0ABR9ZW84_9FIRM|nr:histidine kinase dimerization/phospho-acceptor domain-containing protein [Fusibacter ferrireducens]MBF4694398.1 HAMP domain-containing protein [Fusibacter ferrireducens]
MKHRTLKTKMIILFSLAFLLMLIGLLMANKFFMADFYIYTNKDQMIKNARSLEAALIHPDEMENLFNQSNHLGGAKAFVLNSEGVFMQELFQPKEAQIMTPIDHEFIDHMINEVKTNQKIEGFEVLSGDHLVEGQLILLRPLKDGKYLLMIKMMGIAEEVIRLNVLFLMSSAVVIFAIALILIVLISERTVKPIRKMVAQTKRMSKFKFDEPIVVTSEDEIGQLSTSINKLSEALSDHILKLAESNEKLNRELAKEKSLEKMRRRFVSDVSHELKNPISMILGYAEGLKYNVVKTDEAKLQYYDIMIEESNKMSKLIRDLLDLSSYDSGTFSLSKEEVDMSVLLRESLERFEPEIQKKGVQVDTAIIESLVIHSDPLRVNQIITNLMSNAIKYVDEMGTIQITLELCEVERKLNEAALEETALDETGGHLHSVKLRIANTGALIPEQDLDQIWNSFYQIDTENEGNGLGLAIVKSLVNRLEGQCTVSVEPPYNVFEVLL